MPSSEPIAPSIPPPVPDAAAPLLRILVVEDDRELEMPITRALRTLHPGVEVEWFEDADRVYWQLARQHYDLVIADVWLRGATNGIRLWRLCRNLAPQVPFVLMSASGADLGLRQLGPDGPRFLPKPFSLESFRACVQAALEPTETC